MANDTTPNFKLPLPVFNKVTYQNDYYAAMKIIDAVLAKYIAVANLQGIWENSTEYAVGDVIVDGENSTLYRCEVAHTSTAAPQTFAEELVDHADYWENEASLLTTINGALPHITVALTTANGAAALGTDIDSKILDFDFEVDYVFAECRTPVGGSSLLIDVNKNGASIFGSQKLAIEPTQVWSGNSSAEYELTTTLFEAGSEMSFDIDQLGTTTGVKVTVYGRFVS